MPERSVGLVRVLPRGWPAALSVPRGSCGCLSIRGVVGGGKTGDRPAVHKAGFLILAAALEATRRGGTVGRLSSQVLGGGDSRTRAGNEGFGGGFGAVRVSPHVCRQEAGVSDGLRGLIHLHPGGGATARAGRQAAAAHRGGCWPVLQREPLCSGHDYGEQGDRRSVARPSCEGQAGSRVPGAPLLFQSPGLVPFRFSYH